MCIPLSKKLVWIVIIILGLPAATPFAQETTVGNVTGVAVVATTNRPLENVNVVLQRKADTSVVRGTVTDRAGRFTIKDVPAGEYFCRFSLIGYTTRLSASFVVDAQRRNPNLGRIPLVETAVSLDEVLVTRDRALFNNSIDRKVYNVGQDILSSSGSASELLQNIPSIEVDIEGNVSLRGSSDVLILINGKNSPLMGKNRATVLQQLPASSIEKIEVITNPSARYKPDGTSGIINLVLKKNTALGVNGSLTGNAGNQSRYNGNLRLNYNPGEFNLFGSYGVRKDNRNRINTDSRLQTDASSILTLYREDLRSLASPLSHMVMLGCNVDVDGANSIGLSGNLFFNGFTRTDLSAKLYQTTGGTTINAYDRNRLDPEYEKEYGSTAFFEHKFTGDEHRLRFEVSASRAPEQEDNHFTNTYLVPPLVPSYDNTLIKQIETRYQLQVDYSNPLTAGSNLEAGYGAEINRGDYDFFAEYFDPSVQRFVEDVGKTNHFIFDETVHALYATYRRTLGGFGFQAGLRTEQVFVTSNLLARDSSIANDYFNLYPTLHLSYRFSDAAELQLSYSRRTHRPEGDDLNPFPEYQDARNISAGNPHLLPEYIHSFELGGKLQNGVFSFLPALYYRSTYNRFTSFTQLLNDTTLLTTKVNLSRDQSAGLELVGSADIGEVFTSHVSATIFYNQIDASNIGYSQNKSIVTWSGALTVDLNFAKTSMIQIKGNYSSARLTPQGEYRPSYMVNVGVRQELFDGRMSAILTVADLFHTLKRELNLNTTLLVQNVVNTRDSQIIYIGLTYHFGAPPKKSREEQIRYDDSI